MRGEAEDGAQLKGFDWALQDLMDVVKEYGFDVNSPDCIALANDVRRLMKKRNDILGLSAEGTKGCGIVARREGMKLHRDNITYCGW